MSEFRFVEHNFSDGATVPMILHCPMCGERHIDEGAFAEKAHHTHACQGCGHVWRPAKVNTHGVQFLPGFKNEEPPPMTSNLLELAKRCEEATGPDRELDRTIELAIYPDRLSPVPTLELLAYTASIDAALTLLPTDPETDDQMVWALDTNTFVGCEASIYTTDNDAGPDIRVEAATPALALCAASLRARADGARE